MRHTTAAAGLLRQQKQRQEATGHSPMRLGPPEAVPASRQAGHSGRSRIGGSNARQVNTSPTVVEVGLASVPQL